MTEEQAINLNQHIRMLIVNALKIPQEEVIDELSFGDLPQWDSMGHMEVMMELESEYGVEINADTIAALTSIPAICTYLKENQHV